MASLIVQELAFGMLLPARPGSVRHAQEKGDHILLPILGESGASRFQPLVSLWRCVCASSLREEGVLDRVSLPFDHEA
jgi:hypothetical protein